MVDKDFIAVDYANRNAARNGLTNAHAQLSNGFAHVDPGLRFDLIASNIPAKVGKELLAILLHDAMRGSARRAALRGHHQRTAPVHEAQPGRGLRQLRQAQAGPHYTVALAVREAG